MYSRLSHVYEDNIQYYRILKAQHSCETPLDNNSLQASCMKTMHIVVNVSQNSAEAHLETEQNVHCSASPHD